MDQNEVIAKTNTGWQWDKKINVFSVLGVVLALAGWTFAIQNRVSLNEKAIETNATFVDLKIEKVNSDIDSARESIRAQEAQNAVRQEEIMRMLDRIEDGTNRTNEALTRHLDNPNADAWRGGRLPQQGGS